MNSTAQGEAPILPDALCYLNGDYSRLCDAKASVLEGIQFNPIGTPVGHGTARGLPGPVYERLYAGHQTAKAQLAT
jgi:hypothetical protein